MANTKKTVDLLTKELKELYAEETAQNKVVLDLEKKKVHSLQHWEDAATKLTNIQNTIKDYEKDKKA